MQFSAEPVFESMLQALPSLQLSGQSPSQVSPASVILFPQLTEQSSSTVESQPAGQQPSAAAHSVICWWLHATLQFSLEPVMVSMVQAVPSLQPSAQSPSQVSPVSTAPLPQLAEQSLSVLALQAAGQQPSSSAQAVISAKLQATLQFSGEPVFVSVVQALPSSHSVGQSPSQVSPGSLMSLPQEVEQSSSTLASQPTGQQPSALTHSEICWWPQAMLQLATEPVAVSMVQALPSLQSAGQSPSQVSPGSVMSLPQFAEQSVSVFASQAAGQQPSSSLHWVISA